MPACAHPASLEPEVMDPSLDTARWRPITPQTMETKRPAARHSYSPNYWAHRSFLVKLGMQEAVIVGWHLSSHS